MLRTFALFAALALASTEAPAEDVAARVRSCDVWVTQQFAGTVGAAQAAAPSPCRMGPERLDDLIPPTIELRREIRGAFPDLTDAELEAAKGSVGIALVTRGDVAKGLEVLVRESWLLSPSAQITLEALYESPPPGLGLAPYDPRILAFYRAHAELGWPRSEFMLGKILLHGWGVTGDRDEGLRLLTRSDLPEAHVVLGDEARRAGDAAAAEAHYRKAAGGGLAPGLYELAILARERGDAERAVALFLEALEADPGLMEARVELARHYAEGSGVEASPEKAFEMMKTVADQGTGAAAAIAQTNVGICYLEGIGVEPSLGEARIYLRKAASTGVLRAEEILRRLPQ